MSKQVQLRRGTTAENDAFTGAVGELTYDTTLKRLRMHDGSTAGGYTVGSGTIRDYTFTSSDTLPAIEADGFSGVGTVVDAVVYDTSLDTDGGAWRYRCEHTSWFQEVPNDTCEYLGAMTTAESLVAGASEGDLIWNTTTNTWQKYIVDNTAYIGEHYGNSDGTWNNTTRGIRAEFPAVVAVIAEAAKVWIFDVTGSTPVLWMRFDTTNMIGGITVATVAMQYSSLLVGGNGALYDISLLKDYSSGYDAANYFQSNTNISDRNNGNNYRTINTTNRIVNSTVNDVAITTLPNAPIDHCFVGETLVTMADGSNKRIDQVKPEDVVKTLEGEAKVLRWLDQGIKQVFEYEFDDGTTLICTPDHKIRTSCGWVEAQNLTDEMEIVSI